MATKLNTILATGILADENIADNLAALLDTNNQIAKFLIGDLPLPSAMEALEYVVKQNKERKDIQITNIEYSRDLTDAIVTYTYTRVRWIKENGQTWPYKDTRNEEEGFTIQHMETATTTSTISLK